MKRLVEILAVALTCGAIALSADLFRVAGLSLYTEQVLAGLLAIATPLVFLHVSAGGGSRRARAGALDHASAANAGFFPAGLPPRCHSRPFPRYPQQAPDRVP